MQAAAGSEFDQLRSQVAKAADAASRAMHDSQSVAQHARQQAAEEAAAADAAHQQQLQELSAALAAAEEQLASCEEGRAAAEAALLRLADVQQQLQGTVAADEAEMQHMRQQGAVLVGRLEQAHKERDAAMQQLATRSASVQHGHVLASSAWHSAPQHQLLPHVPHVLQKHSHKTLHLRGFGHLHFMCTRLIGDGWLLLMQCDHCNTHPCPHSHTRLVCRSLSAHILLLLPRRHRQQRKHACHLRAARSTRRRTRHSLSLASATSRRLAAQLAQQQKALTSGTSRFKRLAADRAALAAKVADAEAKAGRVEGLLPRLEERCSALGQEKRKLLERLGKLTEQLAEQEGKLKVLLL